MEGISKRMLDDEESHVGSPGLRRQTNDGQECGAGTWGEASIHSTLLCCLYQHCWTEATSATLLWWSGHQALRPILCKQASFALLAFTGKREGELLLRERITFEQIKLRHLLSLIVLKSSVTQYFWFLETMQKIEEGLHGARASSLWRDCASGGLQHKGVMLVHPGTAKALFQPFCLSNPLLGLRAGDREWNANCTGARFIALWRSLANSTHLRTALSPKKQSSFAIKIVFANVTSERDSPLYLRLSKLQKTF